ncbi:hypothetical protein [Dyadobacter fermentans]|uniref:hypothetical protein n=1 Tax=Dyadobacter fermentans TaxID=94254 RepID=UPI001CBEE477|nr:hypothetical protein [Dyadobacter fermentans]MBZ1359098.1 hypothetical protein [Dyadobacter fermentans]
MRQQAKANALSLHAQGHCPNVLSYWFATNITCLTALIVGALLSSSQETAKSRQRCNIGSNINHSVFQIP